MVQYGEQPTAAYACVNHPVLDPDAWHQVEYARPTGEGAQAALVCRFACLARNQCPFAGGIEVVAGYGWYDHKGVYIASGEHEIEAQQAAAYIGIKVSSFRYLAQRRNIRPVRQFRHLYFYPLDEVLKMAYQHGPEHGTAARLKVHRILGQNNCTYCNSVMAEAMSPA